MLGSIEASLFSVHLEILLMARGNTICLARSNTTGVSHRVVDVPAGYAIGGARILGLQESRRAGAGPHAVWRQCADLASP